MPAATTRIAGLLHELGRGDRDALEELLGKLQPHLRRLARGMFRHERRDHTLQPTVLVDEVLMRLVVRRQVPCKDTCHFLRLAAEEMRRILIGHGRGHQADKRGGGVKPEPLLPSAVPAAGPVVNPALGLAVRVALNRLAERLPEYAKVVELHEIEGYTLDGIAARLGTSRATVRRRHAAGIAWLRRELATGGSP